MKIKSKNEFAGFSLSATDISVPTSSSEKTIFEDDFRNGLENWKIVNGSPETVTIKDDAYVKLSAGDEIDSIDLFGRLTLPGFFRFSFDLKKSDVEDMGSFYINFNGGGLILSLPDKTTNTIRYSQVLAFSDAYYKSLKVCLACDIGSVLFGNISIEELTATHVENFNGDVIDLAWSANPNCSYEIKEEENNRFLEVQSDYKVQPFPNPTNVNILSRKEIISGFNAVSGEYYGAVLNAIISADASESLEVSVYGNFNDSYNQVATSDRGTGLANFFSVSHDAKVPYNNRPEKAMLTYGVGVFSFKQASTINTIRIKQIQSYVGVVGKTLII